MLFSGHDPMNSIKKITVALTVSLATVSFAFAQAAPDHTAQGAAEAAPTAAELPEICRTTEAPAAAPMAMGGEMDEAHHEMMMTMEPMHTNMAQGMMAEDIDVAFVCGMIPHHQGAIDMAKVELQYGDDAWAKEMAQKVIDAQEQEIADMLAWLEEQS
jgi:uncharacterized protein (DUF305 family)